MAPEREPGPEKGLSHVHATENGPIDLWAYPDVPGGWKAVVWGDQLAAGQHFETAEMANAYLVDSFRAMFPRHECGVKCGTAESVAQRNAVERR